MDTDRKRTRIDAKLKALATAQVPRKAESATPEPIAIVGIAGFFPQCASVAEFWNAIDQDRSLLEEVPIDRFDVDEVFCPGEIREGKTRSKWGGFIPNIRQFDASYFGILPDEAERMDPRQRLLLMAVRQALVDAGYRPDALRGTKTGVFVGAEHNEYAQCMADADVDVGTGLHQSDSMLANGLSYFFDLRGPSESVNAMCAGGAVALHRAVVAMRAGEIDQAVVGAANLILKPDIAIKLSQSGQMSPIGTVKSFGADADGFLCGEGVCAMLLKPLGRAQADGDAIHALIRHTAVNYNGQGSSSIAAPSVAVHSQLIQTCYRQAGVDPRDVRYIEAQGMGNPASDIAEWDAFNHALKTLADEKGAKLPEGNCYVSTLKPLSGHLHAASALAAICKVVRSFRTGMIQGVLGFDTINPHLTLGGMPCRIAEQSDAWPSGRERIAGVHSFGAGGNNAHILIEAYHEPAEEQSEQTGDMILPVSAPTPQLLEQAVFALRAKVAAHAEYPLWRIALTLSHGRETFASRVVFVAASREEWLSQSEAFLKGEACSGVWLQDATTENNDVRLSEQGMALRWLVGEEVAWPAPEQHGPWRVHLPAAPLDTQPYWFSSCSSRTRDDASISVSDLGARTWAEQVVRTALGALLRRPGQELDLNAELSEMGFDSLMVRHLCRRMRDDHGVEIEPALLFELTRPVRLVEWLANRGHPSRASSPKRAPRPMRPCLIKGGREPIAIIGLAGVYPKAANVDKLWRNLVAGLDCIDELPTERWATSHFFEPDPARAVERGLSYGKWGGFLEDLHAFDPLFFYLSHAEAQYMHPKERLFMQCAWHALEDAGYPPGALATEKVGVFVGVSKAGYDNYRDSFFSVANRVSYRFNFTGPSMPVDTACSSSLSAIHEACLHLQSGECDLALAGGVNAYTHPSTFAEFSRLGVMSPDGKSRAFGDGANGFVPGEGVGAVLLKPLERALEDGDHIHGVILGSAINHGGKTNGYTVPNPEAHRLLIRQALTRSGISASAIGYVEAHGTGTALGDPIELRGLTEAFLEDGVEVGACRLGSVKTNIGHLEAAAGIAGLTKILLQMRHRQFVPSLHSSTLNPDIVWHASPFRVQQRVEAWDALPADHSHSPRIAGLSSFGAGGSNAHLIVQEAPDDTRPKSPDQGRRLFVLSARNEAALRRYVDSLLNFIESGVPVSLTDLTYTLQIGREAMQWRLACVAESLEALASDLRGFISGAPGHGVQVGKIKRVEQRLGAFSVDEDAHRLARQWFDQGKLHYLAKLWLDGEELDWRALYQGGDARRISLPGYPFDKEVIPPAPMVSPIGVGEVRDLTLTSTGTLTDGGGLGTLLVKPRWQPAALRRGGWRGPVRVVCCELRGADEVPGWLKLPGEERGIAERFKAHSISISETLRHIIKDGARTSTLVQLLIPSRHRWLCGLSGLLKTASLESSRIQAQLIEVPEGMAGAELADVATRAAQLDETWLRHDGSGFSALRWDDIRLLGTSNLPPWKDDGVYLLTGGLGGLARLFAEDIAQHARRVTLVLVGRSPLSERHAQWLKVLNASGVCAIYQQADIANAAEAECLVADIESLKGALTGVLHCAGVQRDAFIINSRPEDWHSVMAPKTEGIVNLDRATRHCRLDCFIVFSSASAAVGHPGQAGYAAANGFMDGFVEERQALVAAGERHGRTVAIDWGLWRDGGMQVSAEVERMLQDGSGMIPLSRESGLCACYDALASGDCRVLVIEGDVARLRRTLSGTATGKLASPARGEMRQVLWSALSEVLGISPDNIDEQADFESVGLDQPAFNRMLSELGLHYALELSPLLYRECRTIAELEHHMAARLGYMDGTTAPGVEKGNASERAAEYLKNLLSSVIQLPEHRIDADEPFERYGIDSLMVMKMTAKLEETFGCLPKTLFYEYQNIRELSHYFAEKHGNILAEQTRVPECALPSASVASAEPTRQGAALPDEAGGGISRSSAWPDAIPVLKTLVTSGGC
ncbi:SDR family NAD(P)-dependent oxidoreductase [Chromobacterium sp. IIBBL 290-4]|uniref:SDR family NAD(P)-dependent oxidoreductase n=1 Tax=Chromobacterium sp. IIBBL 290-4 TaxID=2953890 RepID=UPI0020B86010|nr:SDR family NAD(P)-dependent oxidoreductase [Chromobacterium sp. IIBBL 290-4]UTH76430.1 SDR family NAD(P)-dependent oxidoreductase [Chromobacterium sp. IIBBL 290-4]